MAGSDTIYGSDGTDTIDGGDGRDTLIFFIPSSDILASPTGSLTYTLTDSSFTSSSGAINTSFSNIESFVFSVDTTFNITFDGSGWTTTETFNRGSWTFSDGDDDIIGSAFDDVINTGSGLDTVDAGAGADRVSTEVFDTGDLITVFSDANGVHIDQNGQRLLNVTNAEAVQIGRSFTEVARNVDASAVSGTSIWLQDGGGDDTLIGSSGDDIFVTTTNSFGNDVLTGNGGADRYDFNFTAETLDGNIITDFDADDLLDFSFNDPGFGSAILVNNYIGEAAFSGTAGQIRSERVGGETLIQTDGDGDGVADGTLRITNGEFLLESSGDPGDLEFFLSFAGVTARVFGTGNVDTLRGTNNSDILDALGGNDRLFGRDGDDLLYGGDGDDYFYGGNGTDVLNGGDGDDLYLIDDALDAVVEHTDNGTDLVRTRIDSYTLTANVERGLLLGVAVELIGNDEDNRLSGSSADNTIYGMGGDDLIFGGNGADTLYGGDDADTINGGSGFDTIYGGEGIDTINGAFGDDIIYGGGGNDILNGNESADEIHGDDGNDTLRGGIGIDTLFGDADNDVLRGEDGADTLDGGTGNDTLVGGNGNDVLIGGDGLDRLIGGDGLDTMTGGAGADIFQWDDIVDFNGFQGNLADIITDFSQTDGDRIRLAAIDDFINAEDGFTFIGQAAFSTDSGEIRYSQDGTNTFVEFDFDGNAVVDLTIQLDGLIDLTVADFIL